MWSPERLPAARRDPDTGYASDADTIRGALGEIATADPELVVVNLSDVDRNGHAHGPDSAEYAAAVGGADTAIGVLVDDLRGRGRWEHAVVLVTADHGMSAVGRQVVTLGPALRDAGIDDVTVVADGGIEHVYANGLDPHARDVAPGAVATALARVAALASRTDGVVEVVARLPGACPACPLLAVAHPDWHLDHERAGELLAVAAPGRQFVDPFDPVDARLHGNHGRPEDRLVPLAVTGGWPGLRAAPPGAPSPDAVDVAPTIEAILGLRPVHRLDGRAIPDDGAGRPIAAVLRDAPR
jgi:arylsulfatase A-like enzyme